MASYQLCIIFIIIKLWSYWIPDWLNNVNELITEIKFNTPECFVVGEQTCQCEQSISSVGPRATAHARNYFRHILELISTQSDYHSSVWEGEQKYNMNK